MAISRLTGELKNRLISNLNHWGNGHAHSPEPSHNTEG
jgi:hypothetical protein